MGSFGAIQFVHRTVRTMFNAKEEHWEVKIDVTAVGRRTSGFLLTRFEVGRDGREACEGTRHVFRRRNLGVDKQEASSES